MSESRYEPQIPLESAAASPGDGAGWHIAVILGLVIVVLATGFGLFASFVPEPQLPAGPLTATADEAANGQYRQQGDLSGSPLFAGAATRLDSKRNITATHSSSVSAGNCMFDRTLAIYNLDDGLLMQRVGLALFEQLQETGRFQQLHYLPAGDRLPDGEPLPDLFVTLDVTSWEESGLPGSRQYKGELIATAGDRLRRSNISTLTNLSPPQVQFRWNAELDYSAKQTGIETSGARYQAVARDIAGELTERLTKLVDEMADQYGTPGNVPGDLSPEYAPPPDFAFVKELGLEKRVDGPELMKSTMAVWQTGDDRPPQEVIAAVSAELEDTEWKVPEQDEDREYLRATSGAQVLVVFRENAGRYLSDWEPGTATRMYVVYTRAMPSEEIKSAVGRMFADGADESALLMFQNQWYRHRNAVEEHFREQPPLQATSWLQLARFRKESDPDAARQALLRASALQRIVQHKQPDSSMKKLAKELELELPTQISHEMIQTLGLGELPEPGELTLRVRQNQPAPIWLGDGDEGQVWLLLTPIRRHNVVPEQTLQVVLLRLKGGGWSRAEQTAGDLTNTERPVHTQYLRSTEQVSIFSQPAADGDSYELTLRRTAPE